jgi:crotonobetainyl-CoA:carnitine CoA-transferase CaiB-like acyl-CoA transferase
MGGATGARSMDALAKWMDEEAMGSAYLKKISWSELDFSKLTTEMVDNVVEPISKFFLLHTKDDLFHGALRRGIMLNPVYSMREVTENPQLKARDFWLEVGYHGLENTVLRCKLPFQVNGAAPYSNGRAPLVGEHNERVYCDELGLSKKELLILRRTGIL